MHQTDADEMDAYERLLGDAMAGDATLFSRAGRRRGGLGDRRSDPGRRDAGPRVRAGHLGPARRRAPDRRRRAAGMRRRPETSKMDRSMNEKGPPRRPTRPRARRPIPVCWPPPPGPPSWSPTAPGSGSARGAPPRRSSRALGARARRGLQGVGRADVGGVGAAGPLARRFRSSSIDRGDAARPHRRRRRRGDAQPRSRQGARRRLRARADRGGGLAPADHPGDAREAGPGAVRQRKRFPVEVIPMALGLATRRLKALGLSPVQRVDPAAGGAVHLASTAT